MADYSLCRVESCPRKLSCFRYRTPASGWRQSFFSPDPASCGHYAAWRAGATQLRALSSLLLAQPHATVDSLAPDRKATA